MRHQPATHTPAADTLTAQAKLRRRLLQAACLAAATPASWAAKDTLGSDVRLGQSIALTGPLGDLGQALLQGAKAHFDAVNAKGGIHGRRIELVTQDDGYDVKRAVANVEALLADSSTFALFNCFGTPMCEAVLPAVVAAGIPFFAPFTGALSLRVKERNVFNIRASYPDEAEQLVKHLSTLGIKRVAVAYQNNSFGKEVFEGVRVAADKYQVSDIASATVENTGADATATATKLLAGNPDAILVGLAGKPTLDFVKAVRQQRKGVSLYALSIMGSAATLKALGDDATGIAVSQVVPLPNNAVVPVVRDFQQAWKAAGATLEPSHLALEGYINARVFTEALRRAGKDPSRASFIDALWGLRQLDLGGYFVNATEPGRNASRFVELSIVGRNGRFVR
ncbi:MAG: ABC transporter substrate-binding protein [Burkholderiales bacterium]|nr:ABC transporter substrate-binding protein [Burkholderiales bacterium]